MLPKLKAIHEIGDLSFWQTTCGKIGTGFELIPYDLESEDFNEFSQRLSAFIKQLDPNIIARVHFESSYSPKRAEGISRSDAINQLGYKSNRFYFYINHVGGDFNFQSLKSLFVQKTEYSRELQSLIKLKDTIQNFGFKISPLSKDIISKLFEYKLDLIKTTKSIESDTESIGVIRLLKQSNAEIDHLSLNNALSKIQNFQVTVSFRTQSEAKTKILLEKKLKQLQSQNDISSMTQATHTAESIHYQFSQGLRFVEFEFLVLFKRVSQNELFKDMSSALTELNRFADFKIESYGLAESFVASHPGSNQHVILLESDQAMSLHLPLFVKNDTDQILNSRSLTLFREDQTLSHFDLFNPNYNCFNTLIIGSSGKGKSVLTGLLTQSLLTDKNIQIIKVDVGGSHSKECEFFGGVEYKMKLNEPSGINPFDVIHIQASDSEKIGILSKFLSVLILENGETQFSKDLKSQIEESIQTYIGLLPENPDLQDFYNQLKEFPRKNLLKRWVKGGVYESAFKRTTSDKTSSKQLRYFNFSQVFEAADPEFAQAGIAAVLAQFNMDCISANGKRLVLICDETPFFIKSCFDFFKFSTANVRKYGHAVVLISQVSTDMIVGGDSGIIENSPQRFLFSTDGSLKEYQERFNLSDQHMKTVGELMSIPKVLSEVFLQTGSSGKKLRIQITADEYWKLTTSQPDQQKIQKLRQAVPELKLSEALKCLSLI